MEDETQTPFHTRGISKKGVEIVRNSALTQLGIIREN